MHIIHNGEQCCDTDSSSGTDKEIRESKLSSGENQGDCENLSTKLTAGTLKVEALKQVRSHWSE